MAGEVIHEVTVAFVVLPWTRLKDADWVAEAYETLWWEQIDLPTDAEPRVVQGD